jgi:hypothetical protein
MESQSARSDPIHVNQLGQNMMRHTCLQSIVFELNRVVPRIRFGNILVKSLVSIY